LGACGCVVLTTGTASADEQKPVVAGTASVDEKKPVVSKEDVLKAQAGALDAKLKELFSVPETPAAEALGLTGSAIAHPDTVKDVALQVLGSFSDDAALSQGVALEFAPFRQAVYQGSLEDFEKLAYGQHLAGGIAFSLAAVTTPDGNDPGVRYAVGFRVPFLDDRDYRRNPGYRAGLMSALSECARRLGPTETLTPQKKKEILDQLAGLNELISTLLKARSKTSEARRKLTEAEGALVMLGNDTTTPALDLLTRIEQQKIKLADAQNALRAAEQQDAKSVAAIWAAKNSIGKALENFGSDKKRDKDLVDLKEQLNRAGDTLIAAGFDPSNPATVDTNREGGGERKQTRLHDQVLEVCSAEIEQLNGLADQLTGNRLEMSTATIIADPDDGRPVWEQSTVAGAYERRWKASFVGVAARGKFFDAESLRVQLDGGLRAGFDTGMFKGSLSAAAGATDLSSPAFVFPGGADASVVVAETFLARLGVLSSYQYGPNVGVTAYITIATANGEDFFTRVIASK